MNILLIHVNHVHHAYIRCIIISFQSKIFTSGQGGLLKSGPAHMEKVRKKTVMTQLGVMPLKKIVQSYLFLFQKGIIVCRQKKNPENAREERFIFIKYFPINNIDLKVVSEDCFDLHNSETDEKLKIVFFESSKHEDKTGAGGIFCNTVE